jgi:hypothetical protein
VAKKKPKPACEKDGKRREGQLVASLRASCPSLVLSAVRKSRNVYRETKPRKVDQQVAVFFSVEIHGSLLTLQVG